MLGFGVHHMLSYPRRVRPGFRNAWHCAGRTPKPCRALAGTSRHSFVVRKRLRAPFGCGEKPGVARRQPSFFASPKKEGKERRPPGSSALRAPLRCSQTRAAAELGLEYSTWLRCILCSPLDSPRGPLPRLLRCSATLMGTPCRSATAAIKR